MTHWDEKLFHHDLNISSKSASKHVIFSIFDNNKCYDLWT